MHLKYIQKMFDTVTWSQWYRDKINRQIIDVPSTYLYYIILHIVKSYERRIRYTKLVFLYEWLSRNHTLY